MKIQAIVLAILCALSACSTLSPDVPRTPREMIAAGYASIEIAADLAAGLHSQGVFDDARAAETRTRLESAKGAVDAAFAAETQAGDSAPETVKAAADALALVNAILSDIQSAQGNTK